MTDEEKVDQVTDKLDSKKRYFGTDYVDNFDGRYSFLSNFWEVDIEYKGLTFQSVEHAFHSEKTLDPKLKLKFVKGACFWCAEMQSKHLLPNFECVVGFNSLRDKPHKFSIVTASKAKHFGKKLKLRSDWEQVKIPIMLELLRIKFTDPTMRSLLLATKDMELIEGNWWNDQFWGVCDGVGQNQLGKLLMQVRSEIRGLPEIQHQTPATPIETNAIAGEKQLYGPNYRQRGIR